MTGPVFTRISLNNNYTYVNIEMNRINRDKKYNEF